RYAQVLHPNQADPPLDGAGGRQRVPNHRLVGRDRHAAGALAKHGRDAHAFHLVVLGRAGAVGVDIVDVVRREPRIGNGAPDAADDRLTIRARPGAVKTVRQLAPPGDHTENFRRPPPGMIPRLFAPRTAAASWLSSTSAPAPSAITKPSRFFANGFAAACGGSFCIERAESSENRIRVSALTEPSVATHSAASVSPRRIASRPS